MKLNPVGAYRVTAFMDYEIVQLHHIKRDFRWYWQANTYSWFLHHIGYSCNTWKKD